MQLKTLWSIILKTIGVYFAFSVVQMFFFTGGMSVNLLFRGNGGDVFMSSLLMLLVEAVLAYMCLFRTDRLIQLFKLEESIPEKYINANIETRSVLRLAIAIIGIYSLSNSVPELLGLMTGKAAVNMYMISFLKILIGLLMVLRNSEIETFIRSRQTKN